MNDDELQQRAKWNKNQHYSPRNSLKSHRKFNLKCHHRYKTPWCMMMTPPIDILSRDSFFLSLLVTILTHTHTRNRTLIHTQRHRIQTKPSSYKRTHRDSHMATERKEKGIYGDIIQWQWNVRYNWVKCDFLLEQCPILANISRNNYYKWQNSMPSLLSSCWACAYSPNHSHSHIEKRMSHNYGK